MTSTQQSLKDLKVLTSIIKLQQQIEALVWYSREKVEAKLISIAPKWRRKNQEAPTLANGEPEQPDPVYLFPCPPGAVLIFPGTNKGKELSTCIQSQPAGPLEITTQKHRCNPRLIYNGMGLRGNKSQNHLVPTKSSQPWSLWWLLDPAECIHLTEKVVDTFIHHLRS